MKLIFTLIAAFFLLSHAVYAETKIFGTTAVSNKDIKIDGGVFRFVYDEPSDKMFVQNPLESFVVQNSECSTNSVYRVCLNKANYSYRNITTYEKFYSLDLEVYKKSTEVEVNYTAGSSKLLGGESTELKITISNPSSLDANGVYFSQNLSQFYVSNVEGCQFEGGLIKWGGVLQSGSVKSCSATLTADTSGKIKLIARINYSNAAKSEGISKEIMTIEVLPSQLSANLTFDKVIEIGEPFHVNLTLKNQNSDENIGVTARLVFPETTTIIDNIAGFDKSTETFRDSFILEKGSSKSYFFHVKVSSAKNPFIDGSFDFSIKNRPYKISSRKELNIIDLIPSVNLSSEYSYVLPGQKYFVIAKVKNPSNVHPMRGLKAVAVSDYGDLASEERTEILPNQTYDIISARFLSPNVSAINESGIKISLSLSYDYFGAVKTLKKSINVGIAKNASEFELLNKASVKGIAPAGPKAQGQGSQIKNDSNEQVNRTAAAPNISLEISSKSDSGVSALNSGNKGNEFLNSVFSWFRPQGESERAKISPLEIAVLAAVIVLVLFIIPFVIYKIKNRKKSDQYEESQSQLQNNQGKNEGNGPNV